MLFIISRIEKHFGKQLEATRNYHGFVIRYIIYFHNMMKQMIISIKYVIRG